MAESQDALPKLIVVVVIDELDNEQMLVLQGEFSDKGFNRIASEGMRFMSAVSFDISGYPGTRIASLFSGTPPSDHGIIGETWVNRKFGNFIEPACYDSAGLETIINYNQSKSLADYLKSVYGSKAKSATIGINSPWMVHSLGYKPDYIFAFDKVCGSFYNALIPESYNEDWLNNFNKNVKSASLLNRQWGPIKDVTGYVEYRNLPEEIRKDFRSFFYSMKTFSDIPYSYVASSPFANTLLRDFAVSFLSNSDFGKTGAPCLLTLGFTSRPFVSNSEGLLSVEKEDMLLRLDDDIASLVEFLDFEYGCNNYLLILSSGASSAPDNTVVGMPGITSGTVEFRKISALLNLYLMALHGREQWVLGISDNFVYLNQKLIEEKELDLKEIQRQCAEFIMEFSGIKFAMPTHDMLFDCELAKKYADNLFPQRMPDIILSLLPGWKTNVTELGSRQTGLSGHNYVPMYLRGWRVKHGAWFTPFEVYDLTPLILQQLGINHPNEVKVRWEELFKK